MSTRRPRPQLDLSMDTPPQAGVADLLDDAAARIRDLIPVVTELEQDAAAARRAREIVHGPSKRAYIRRTPLT